MHFHPKGRLLLGMLGLLILFFLAFGSSLSPMIPWRGFLQGTAQPGAPATASVGVPTPQSGDASFVARAIARTNYYRQQFGCPALKENQILDNVAYAHSKDMAERGYFAHDTPEGVTPFQRMTAAGYTWSQAAENIAAGDTTPEQVIDAFFNETPPNDGHRRNLLNCGLRDVGIGYFYLAGSPYGSYWTQDFGTP
ncbi:MAG TPA: CAP domain-containing protein [Ktedonobacterales bacterium]|jgi:uncharacterized protein YkwD